MLRVLGLSQGISWVLFAIVGEYEVSLECCLKRILYTTKHIKSLAKILVLAQAPLFVGSTMG
jgi:hypothetical protein